MRRRTRDERVASSCIPRQTPRIGRPARGDVAQRLRQPALAQPRDRVPERADARDHDALGGQHRRPARRPAAPRTPDALERVQHGADVAHAVVDDRDHTARRPSTSRRPTGPRRGRGSPPRPAAAAGSAPGRGARSRRGTARPPGRGRAPPRASSAWYSPHSTYRRAQRTISSITAGSSAGGWWISTPVVNTRSNEPSANGSSRAFATPHVDARDVARSTSSACSLTSMPATFSGPEQLGEPARVAAQVAADLERRGESEALDELVPERPPALSRGRVAIDVVVAEVPRPQRLEARGVAIVPSTRWHAADGTTAND